MFKVIIFATFFLVFAIVSARSHGETSGETTDEMILAQLNRIISESIQDFMSQFDPTVDNSWFESFVNERDNCWFNCKNPICTDGRIREVVVWRCIAMRSMFPDDWEKRL